MDQTAIFKISYGVFYVGTTFGTTSNLCVVNTVVQVANEPLRISVAMLKNGYTQELIQKSGQFSVDVIGDNASLEDIAHFGQSSGRDHDKLSAMPVEWDSLGNPTFRRGCIAEYTCKVIESIDVGTHMLFIADVVDAKNLQEDAPLTYANYRIYKQGGGKPAADTPAEKPAEIWQCSICHYIYDGDIPFEDLPDDYVCPVCGQPKSVFVRI